MYYLEAQIGGRTKYWTGREWVRVADAREDDIEIKAWKRESAAMRAAFKQQNENPHYTICVYGK